jgi:glycosyltransferase involved in cell wall biosynthesis|tara:strand:- start:62 stop:1009 length:948 start_codon:yes stop_codon:yes gene_type:complete
MIDVLSIIVPVYYESDSVIKPYKAITEVMVEQHFEYEIIFVDDGSLDDSLFHLKKIAMMDPRVKLIKLLTNCGAHMAIRAGLENSQGNMGVFIACDLQEPPAIIPLMVEELKKNNDIVLAVRNSRKDKASNRFSAKLFHILMHHLVSKKMPKGGSSMYLLGERALKAIKAYPERNMTLEGIFILGNFSMGTLKYDRLERTDGESRWTIARKLKMLVDFIVAYSFKPIRMVSITGVVLFLLGLLGVSYIILRSLIYQDLLAGWPMLISLIIIGFGFTYIALGIIAEYLWRALDETRKRPKYIIEEKVNFTSNLTDS